MTAPHKLAWIFMALYFWDKSRVSRLEILHSADAIDFVVPSDDELEVALANLIQHGLVEPIDDCFALTVSGMALAEASDAGPHSLGETLKSLDAYFESRGAA